MSTKAHYQYGYFEMRAKIPAGRGYWPAFWLWNNSPTGITPCWYNEIDIFEMNGSNPDRITNTVHFAFSCPIKMNNAPVQVFPCNYSGHC